MGRELTFRLNGELFRTAPVRIDRRKLYGWTEVRAFNEAGEECTLASTDQTGTHLFLDGGTALGILTPHGEWVERNRLRLVDVQGNAARLRPSSYNDPIPLKRKASVEELLEYDITHLYQLNGAAGALLEAVGEAIYTFDYCYLDDCPGNPAFVLANGSEPEPTLFLLVGQRNDFEWVGYDQPAFLDDVDDAEEEPDEPDFDML